MEYPGSRLTRPIRRAILACLILAFFIISPLVILYTAGYRYDWKNGLLKETGAISVDILPNEAVVYLNGIKIKGQMPVRLKNLTPNKYSLKISAPGYLDWSKEVEVKNKQTVYIKEISLLHQTEPKLIIDGDYILLKGSPNGRYLIYSQKLKNKTDIWLRDNQANKNTFLFQLNGTDDLKISWAEKNNYFTLNDNALPHKIFYLINADIPTNIINLLEKEKKPIYKFQWKNQTTPELYYAAANNLYSFFPEINEQNLVTEKPLVDWYLDDNNLYTLVTSSLFGEMILTSTQNSEIFWREKIGTDPTAWQILTVADNTILIKNKNNSEIILLSDKKTYRINGSDYYLSPYQNWWLIWTPWELWSYSLGNEPFLLNRSGEQLQKVESLDKHNTLLLSWAGKTTVLFPYYFVNHELINYPVTGLAVDHTNQKIYYTATNDKKTGLWELSY